MRSVIASLRLIQPLAAYSLTQQSLMFSGFAFHWFQPVALLMFTGGFIAYNFYCTGIIMRFASASALVILLLLIREGIPFIILFAVLMLFSWLYLQPGFKVDSLRFSIRKVPFLKTLLLTIIWTFATAVVPLANQISRPELLIETTARFLFLFPVIIASDRIDFEKDKAAGVMSLPVIAGERMSLRITGFFLLLYLFFLEIIYLPSGNHQHGSLAEVLMLLSVVFTGSIALMKLKNKTAHRILLDLSVSFLFMVLQAFS